MNTREGALGKEKLIVTTVTQFAITIVLVSATVMIGSFLRRSQTTDRPLGDVLAKMC